MFCLVQGNDWVLTLRSAVLPWVSVSWRGDQQQPQPLSTFMDISVKLLPTFRSRRWPVGGFQQLRILQRTRRLLLGRFVSFVRVLRLRDQDFPHILVARIHTYIIGFLTRNKNCKLLKWSARKTCVFILFRVCLIVFVPARNCY